MAKQTRIPVNPQSDPDITWRGAYSLEQREAMIRDAAYYHYAKRGYAPGHDFDDWLAAEAEIERRMAESAEFPPDTDMQQSSVHGAGKDEEPPPRAVPHERGRVDDEQQKRRCDRRRQQDTASPTR